MSPRKHIEFFVNGQLQKVTDEFPLTTTLNSYLRYTLNLTGTKTFCNEGGCGCCVINAQVFDKTLGKLKDFSVNSCLFPLYSCDGYSFTTVEGITANGLHPISKRLADSHGSQCGYCSSGFVMSMYSLLKSKPKPAKKDIESAFDGNICRCTGYRSILDAMKSFSADEKPIDIEDLDCLKCLKVDSDHSCSTVALTNDNKHWFSPSSMNELDSLVHKHAQDLRFVSGNTSVGIYKNENDFKVYVNLKNLSQLTQVEIKPDQLVIGSAVTISNLVEILTDAAAKFENNYGHIRPSIVDNLLRVGNAHVRNVATWSGNLALKRTHPAFPSDVLIALETLNAALNVKLFEKDGQSTLIKMTLNEFITSETLNGSNFLIISMVVPAYEQNCIRIRTYKVSPRSQNSHSYISAGFRITIDSSNVIKSASIVLNGISERFFHATKTENFLMEKNLTDGEVFKKAIETLKEDLESSGIDRVEDPLVASSKYRLTVALSLFYKFFLSIGADKIDKKLEGTSEVLFDWRTVSKGEQTFSSKEELYPLTKPMPKLNAYSQTSGQTKYIDDLTPSMNQLNGAFILSTVANATIEKIDVDEALAVPGVVKILFYKDIPGKNNIMPEPFLAESLFVEKDVFHAGQPIGLVVAKTYQQAKRASKLVKVHYGDLKKPILTFEQAIEANSYHPDPMCGNLVKGDAPLAIKESKHQVSGEFDFGASQFNFYVEGIIGICEPTDDGYSIECSTQWIDCVQRGVANVLGLENSGNIDVKLRQLGGSFGGKATRGNFAAAAAAVAVSHLKVPVKVYMDLNDCMDMIGKRPLWKTKYQVGFDDDGKINGVTYEWYADPGMTTNGCHVAYTYTHFDSAYNSPTYLIKPKIVKTNKPTSVEVRGPDVFTAVCVTEQVLEHIAYHLRKDPLQVREINLFKKDEITASGHKLTYFDICNLVDQLKASCDYAKRKEEIETFNRQNRYKKKGISLIPLRYAMTYKLGYYNALISVRHYDGSVAISHGGVEMGQGIHTKVAQVCAHELGIPLEKISIKSTNNLINPNCLWTGGSVTFELVSKLIGNVFSCKGIQIVVEYFKSRGHKDIKAMVPRFRRGESDKMCPTVNPEILDELEKNGHLTYTPSRFVNQKLILPYDDRFILKAALHFNAIIVSNDNYRDLMKENLDWKRLIETNLLQFSFIGDLFMIADDPLGRYGPKLDQFLSVEFNAQNPPTTNFQNVPNNFYKEPNNFTNSANNNNNISNKNKNNTFNNNSDKFKRHSHKKGFKKNNKKPGRKNFSYTNAAQNKNRVNKLTKKKTTRFNATMKNLMKSSAAQNATHRNFKNNNKNSSFTRKNNNTNNMNNIKNEPKS